MDQIVEIIEALQNLDQYLPQVTQLGRWLYMILFVIVFLDTALFILSFFPSDSLLFTAGALAAFDSLELAWLLLLALVATILADSFNFLVGNKAGGRLLVGRLPFTQPKHMARTREFLVARGRFAIVISRFIPFVRSLTPFVAGMSQMPYRRFLIYNVLGAFLWVGFFTLGGFLFGNIPQVRENLSIILLAVLILSALPGVVELIRGKQVAASQANTIDDTGSTVDLSGRGTR